MSGKIMRFTRGQVCPVCGGSDDDPRGQGTRCHGFLSSDKDWVHCSREEHAGNAKFVAKSETYLHRARGSCPCGVEHAPDDRPGAGPGPRNEIAHVYRYRDASGKVVHETVRYKDKQFRQRRPIGNGRFAWDLKGIQPVLYNLPALIAADPEVAVYVVEGEKDADRLGSLGVLATTSAMGAGKWRPEYADALVGRHVRILPDNDDPGRAHALAIARSLYGRAESIHIVELPDLPPKGDVSDWLDAGGDLERLIELVEEAPEWTPPAVVEEPRTNGNGSGNGNGNGYKPLVDFAAMSAEELGLIPVSAVQPSRQDWAWEFRLPRCEMSLLAGEGGLGKSMFLMACAAAVSRGSVWPAKTGHAPLGTVIVVSAEDHPETTIRPRLQAMGADLEKIVICRARAVIERDGQRLVSPMSLQDRAYWTAVFNRFPDTVLFIVDPVPSYLGRGVNDRQNNEIRAVLEPFIDEVIRPRGVCFYANTHLSKSVDARSPVQRITGSIAYVNIPRNVHIIVRDPDNPARRLFTQVKCNNAPDNLPAIAYQIEQREIPIPGSLPIITAVPVFEEQADLSFSLEDAMGVAPRRGPKPIKSSKLAEWLLERLKDGEPVAISRLVDEAREAKLLAAPTEKVPKPSISPLYEAAERLPELHPEWAIFPETVKGGFSGRQRKAWRLGAADEGDEENGPAILEIGEGSASDDEGEDDDDRPIY